MSQKSFKIAQVYAKALTKLVSDSDKVLNEFQTMCELVASSKELSFVFGGEAFDKEEQQSVLKEILKVLKVQKEFEHFLLFLADKNRLGLLTSIYQAFEQEVYRSKNIAVGSVSSATAMSDSELKELTAAFEAKLGKKVTLKTKENPELLGGFVAEVEGTTFDASVRRRLMNLKNSLGQASL